MANPAQKESDWLTAEVQLGHPSRKWPAISSTFGPSSSPRNQRSYSSRDAMPQLTMDLYGITDIPLLDVRQRHTTRVRFFPFGNRLLNILRGSTLFGSSRRTFKILLFSYIS